MSKYKISRAILWAIFILYCLGLAGILLIRENGTITVLNQSIERFSQEHFLRFSNFVPFKTIIEYFTRIANDTINIDTVVKNLLGNLLLFAPMGFFIPVLFYKRVNKFRKFVIVLFLIIIVIEIIQFITFTGSFDVDDIILNMAGGCLIYPVTKISLVKNNLTE